MNRIKMNSAVGRLLSNRFPEAEAFWRHGSYRIVKYPTTGIVSDKSLLELPGPIYEVLYVPQGVDTAYFVGEARNRLKVKALIRAHNNAQDEPYRIERGIDGSIYAVFGCEMDAEQFANTVLKRGDAVITCFGGFMNAVLLQESQRLTTPPLPC